MNVTRSPNAATVPPSAASEPGATGPGELRAQARTIRGASSILSDFAAIAGGRLSYAILSFVTVLLVTRMLSPAAYGTVATATIVANLINTVSTVWTASAVRRYGREELELRGNMSRVTWNRAVIAAPLTALGLAAIVGLKTAGALPAELTWPFVGLIMAATLALILVGHCQALLETEGRMKVSAAGQVLAQVAYLGALAAFFFLSSHRSPSLVMGLSVASSLLLVVFWLPVVWRPGIWPIEFDRKLLLRMLWLSTPVIGLTVSQYVIGSVDLVVLRWFTTRAAVGIYAVAYQAYTVLSAVAMAAPSVFLPLFVSLNMAGRRDLVVRYLDGAMPQIILLISATVGLGAAMLPVLVPLVFGHAFVGAAKPLALLCIALVLLFGAFLMSPILLLHEQTRKNALINGIAAAINVVGDIVTVAVLHMGVIGPALATSAALGFAFAAYYRLGRRLLGATSRLDLAIAAPLVAGLVPSLALPKPVGSLIGIASVLLATAAVLIWRRPFKPEDVELLVTLDMPPAVQRALLKGVALLPGMGSKVVV